MHKANLKGDKMKLIKKIDTMNFLASAIVLLGIAVFNYF